MLQKLMIISQLFDSVANWVKSWSLYPVFIFTKQTSHALLPKLEVSEMVAKVKGEISNLKTESLETETSGDTMHLRTYDCKLYQKS